MSSIRVSFFLFTLKKPFLYFFSRKNFRGLKIQIFNLDDYMYRVLDKEYGDWHGAGVFMMPFIARSFTGAALGY